MFNVTDSVPRVLICRNNLEAKDIQHMFLVYLIYLEQYGNKSDGPPIQHAEQVCQFISAMMLPKRLAIIKC